MYKFIGIMVLGLLGFLAVVFLPVTMILAGCYAAGKFIQHCVDQI